MNGKVLPSDLATSIHARTALPLRLLVFGTAVFSLAGAGPDALGAPPGSQPPGVRQAERKPVHGDHSISRVRIDMPDGVFFVYDAATPPNTDQQSRTGRRQQGFLAYWSDLDSGQLYVFDRVLYTRADVGHALENLELALPIDGFAIATFDDELTEALELAVAEAEDSTTWIEATRDTIRRAMGFSESNADLTSQVVVAAPCACYKHDICCLARSPVRVTRLPAPSTRVELQDLIESSVATPKCCPEPPPEPPDCSPCCDNPDPCCGDSDPCCPYDDPCCPITDPCDPDCGDPCLCLNCDDGNPCTLDGCAGGACTNDPNPDPCCDNTDPCDPDCGDPCACLNCNDGNPCTIDGCADGACTSEPDPCCSMNCDDGDPCTINGCVAGACTSEPDPDPCCANTDPCDALCGDPCACLNCDDGNPCTINGCVAGACTSEPDPDPCCTNTNPCDPVCGDPCLCLNCDDGNPCTINGCVAGACTSEPKCSAGQNCCANGVCCSVACDDPCVSTGTLSGGTVIANPASPCVGETVTFKASGVVDSGGTKRVNCVDVAISGVAPTYAWTLTVPAGYPSPLPALSGSGPAVSVVAKIPGPYSATFTTTANRECPPAAIALGPATATVPSNYATVEIKYKTFIHCEIAGPTPPDPWLYDFFGGDNRGFGYRSGTNQSRTYQLTWLTVDPANSTGQAGDVLQRKGISLGYDDSPDGSDVTPLASPTCNGQCAYTLVPGASAECEAQDPDPGSDGQLQMSFVRQNGSAVDLVVAIDAGDQCETFVPGIDVNLTLKFRQPCVNGVLQPLEFKASGTFDGYPWHELYLNGVQIFSHDPCLSGDTPNSMFPEPLGNSYNFEIEEQMLQNWQPVPGP